MGRKVFFVQGFSDHFVDHALQVRQDGVNREGAFDTPSEAQVVTNAQGNRVARVRQVDPAIGLDSEDVHMSGDRCVVVAEIPDPKTGDLVQYVERYSDSGARIGSYAVPWHKIGPGRHEKGSPKRIFY